MANPLLQTWIHKRPWNPGHGHWTNRAVGTSTFVYRQALQWTACASVAVPACPLISRAIRITTPVSNNGWIIEKFHFNHYSFLFQHLQSTFVYCSTNYNGGCEQTWRQNGHSEGSCYSTKKLLTNSHLLRHITNWEATLLLAISPHSLLLAISPHFNACDRGMCRAVMC